MNQYDHDARVTLERMNLRPVALASRFVHSIQADFRLFAMANAETEQKKYQQRCVDLCATYGLQSEANIAQNKPFAFSQGVAIIPVHGTLINRFSSSWSYVTGYNYLTRMVGLAGQDPDVSAIVYDVNTYGGEAAGCFECSREMRRLANGKPTMAVIDSNCYSAGMAVASAADKIVSIPSGGAGSIGVVAMHISMEKLLSDFGIKITFIHSGEHKVDGNPFEDLPEDVEAEIQADVDASREEFAQLIADHRKMDKKAVMNTEARCYRAEDARKLGLIDAVATPSQAVAGFLRELSGSKSQLSHQENDMSDANTQPGAQAQATADQDKIRADARKAERERMAGITGCEEAKNRQKLANHLAMNTELSVDQAKAILASSAEESAAASGANAFRQAMDNGNHPNVGADNGGGNGGDGDDRSPAQRILQAQSMATGQKFEAVKH